MKIDEAIEQLVQIQKEYGNDIDIYCDGEELSFIVVVSNEEEEKHIAMFLI